MTSWAENDLLLVREDALLVETLARRGDLSAFDDEPLAALLGALAADVDAGDMAPPSRYQPILVPAAGHRAAPTRPRRHAGLVAATVAACLVGSTGVAAAVTGDPLAAFREAARIVTGADAGPEEDAPTAGPGVGRDGSLPDTAAAEAQLNRSLRQVGRLVARGDLDEARALLASVSAELALLGDDVAPGLEQRLDAVADRIERAADESKGKAEEPKGEPDPGTPDEKAASGTGPSSSGKGPRSSPGKQRDPQAPDERAAAG